MADVTRSHATVDPDQDDREAISRLVAHYHKLQKEIHCPYLDATLLNKYVVQPVERFTKPSSEEDAPSSSHVVAADSAAADSASVSMSAITAQQQRMEKQAAIKHEQQDAVRKLIVLVGIVSDHKQRTLDVLDAVSKRESALEKLTHVLAARANGELTTVEAAVAAQHNLHLLQKATLAVVERVIQWRQPLPFPHPFMTGMENYLLKIMKDTAQLAANAAMAEAVPLQNLFLRFPLLSNLPSLGKYADDPTKPASMRRNGVGAPPVDITFHKRLVAAEDYLHGEVEREMKMLRALLDACRQGYFIPVLDLRKLHPGAAGGGRSALPHPQAVKIFSRDVQTRLEKSLLHSLDLLVHPTFETAYRNEIKKQQQATQSGATENQSS
jgi:hypothetical protein